MAGVAPTNRDIYDALLRLTGRVEGLLSAVEALTRATEDHERRLRTLESQAGNAQGLKRVADDHEERLRIVEKWMRALPVTVLVALLCVIATFVNAAAGP